MPEENDPFRSLLDRLHQFSQWPSVYRFKFIFKTDNGTVLKVENWFDETATIHYLQSSTNKYLSITVDTVMQTPEEVVAIYRKAAVVEGLIAL